MADWPQPVRTKMLADFNLVDESSHTPNLPHAHARLRSLRGVARLSKLYGSGALRTPVRRNHSIWTLTIGERLSCPKREIKNWL